MDSERIRKLLTRLDRELLKKGNTSLPRGTKKIFRDVKATLEDVLNCDDPQERIKLRGKIVKLLADVLPVLLSKEVWKSIETLF